MDTGETLVLASHGENVYTRGGQGVLYDEGMRDPVM